MPDSLVEIFRSARRAECNERAFMLFAVGIPSAMAFDGGEFLVLVDLNDISAARDHLRQYEVELRARRSVMPPPLPRLHPHAWIGSALYALILLAVAYAIANGMGRLDAFDAGELDAGRVQSGQWWRIWTALTLHLDAAHIAANLAAGIWFGYLASRLLGAGSAWLLVMIGAGFANWIEGRFGPVMHRSVGASTAVFAALGLLSAFSWRMRYRLPQSWALRWGPLVAGIALLGWTGTGGEDPNAPDHTGESVDVVAHVLGFCAGAGLGALAAWPRAAAMLDRLPQWLTGLLALAIPVLAWTWALRS